MPAKYIHAPWEAPDHVLATAGVVLGDTYPRPAVDHREARLRYLSLWRKRFFPSNNQPLENPVRHTTPTRRQGCELWFPDPNGPFLVGPEIIPFIENRHVGESCVYQRVSRLA